MTNTCSAMQALDTPASTPRNTDTRQREPHAHTRETRYTLTDVVDNSLRGSWCCATLTVLSLTGSSEPWVRGVIGPRLCQPASTQALHYRHPHNCCVCTRDASPLCCGAAPPPPLSTAHRPPSTPNPQTTGVQGLHLFQQGSSIQGCSSSSCTHAW